MQLLQVVCVEMRALECSLDSSAWHLLCQRVRPEQHPLFGIVVGSFQQQQNPLSSRQQIVLYSCCCALVRRPCNACVFCMPTLLTATNCFMQLLLHLGQTPVQCVCVVYAHITHSNQLLCAAAAAPWSDDRAM